jgi:hypothetical protein
MKRFLTYIDTQIGVVFKRIQKTAWVDTQSLAYFRIFIGLFMLSHYLPEWIWLGEVPQAFFSPHIYSMAGLSDGFLSKNFYLGLDIMNILFFCLMTLGIRTRVSLVLLFLINYTGFSYEFGFGKIDHEIHLYLITLLTLAFTNCGTQVALLKDRVLKPNFQKWALSLLCIYIAFGFFTAGLPKFIKWVDFDMNEIGFLDWFYKGYYNYDRTHLLADMVFKTPKLVFEIADYLAPTIELLAFVFLLLGRRAWRIYLVIMSSFHMGNMLLLNIEFVLNVTCYGLFLIAPFLSYIRKYLPKGRSAKILLVSLVSLFALYQLGYKYYYWNATYAPGFFTERFILNNYISISYWILTIAIGIYTIRKKLYDLPHGVPV